MRGPYTDFYMGELHQRSRTWYRQDLGRKTQLPLPYSSRKGWVSHIPGQTTGAAGATLSYYSAGDSGPLGARTRQEATNRAYNKFVQSLQDNRKAALGTSLAEAGQARNMLVKRVEVVAEMWRAVRKRNVKAFLRLCTTDSTRPPRSPRTPRRRPLTAYQVQAVKKSFGDRTKTAADRFLEIHFGWSPLLQDIYDCVDVLQGPPPPHRSIRAKGQAKGVWDLKEGVYTPLNKGRLDVSVVMGADAYLENPNLDLANRLGLVNLASVVWELIPFSFLVDWFISVGRFLESCTDFVGWRIENPFTTIFRRAKGETARTQEPNPVNNYHQGHSSIYMTRELSLPSYKLLIPAFTGLSLTRGVTAVALLVQAFISGKPSYR